MSRWALGVIAPLVGLFGCTHTTDSLGTNQAVEVPPEGEGTFQEVLGKGQEEVDQKVQDAFEQLFYGDPDSEAIYVEDGEDGAYIYNVAEEDIRTDALGYGLLITVELDRPDEFARLWTYGKEHLQYKSGAREGYLYWHCPETDTGCPDPNGMQYAAVALSFAGKRWGNDDYRADAAALLEVLLHREDLNGGVAEEVYGVFDETSHLVRVTPVGFSPVGYSSALLPAFTDLWAEGAGRDGQEWQAITDASRNALSALTETPTGLPPEHFNVDSGTPYGSSFSVESFRVGLNLGVDHLWHGVSWSEEADGILGFFVDQGDDYLSTYNTDTGESVSTARSPALRATNGAAAIAATLPEREDFIQTVWDMPIPTGDGRYYGGILYLMSLIALSGDLQVVQ